MAHRALLERDEIFGAGGCGWTLRVIRSGTEHPGAYGELCNLEWQLVEDGHRSSHYLTDANMGGGDLMGFIQAIVDAGWEKGVRPSVLGESDKARTAEIESYKAHIKTLERQVSMQHQSIEKLLAK